MPAKRKDQNQKIAALVERATKVRRPAGEELFGSPELRRQFTEAKAAAKKRR